MEGDGQAQIKIKGCAQSLLEELQFPHWSLGISGSWPFKVEEHWEPRGLAREPFRGPAQKATLMAYMPHQQLLVIPMTTNISHLQNSKTKWKYVVLQRKKLGIRWSQHEFPPEVFTHLTAKSTGKWHLHRERVWSESSLILGIQRFNCC